MALGVVGRNGVGDGLQDHGLSRLGWRNDQTTLPLTNGRNQVDDTSGHVGGVTLKAQTLLWVKRSELAELNAVLGLLGFNTVDGVNASNSVELVATLALDSLTNNTGNGIALTQSEATNHREADVNVVGTWQVARRAHKGVVIENVQDARYWQQDIVFRNLWFGIPKFAARATWIAIVPETIASTAALTLTTVIVIARAIGAIELALAATLAVAALTIIAGAIVVWTIIVWTIVI
ncbi:unannotated protein [freshwater metagenome]|uniref:Unannotated protein n=1 Tax=freshwater metagenome TaxID=449393 RepID=A0A6J6XIL6_9ZZZZ